MDRTILQKHTSLISTVISILNIRAVTGHTTADIILKYVRFDGKRIRLDIPNRETYLENFEGYIAPVNTDLVVLAHIY